MSRSLKKGPYVSSNLLKKIDLLNKKNTCESFKANYINNS